MNIISISIILLFIAIFSCEFFMIIVELILQSDIILNYLKKNKKFKKTPKIFELTFFLSLFIGTIGITFASAGFYVEGEASDVLSNMLWFSVLYGIALASGYYHYILRLDDN